MKSFNTRWNGLAVLAARSLSCGLLAFVASCGGGGGGCAAGTSAFAGTNSCSSTTAPVAADMSLSLSAAKLDNNGVSTITATATAVDANRNTLPAIPISISVDSNAVATVSGTSTSSSGVVTATVGVGADRSNRAVTVTATSGTLVRTATFQVTGAKLAPRVTPAVVAPGTAGEVEFVLTDSNTNAMVNQDITVTGVGGVEIRAKTGLSGQYLYTYTAPAAVGTLTISATAGGTSSVATVLVQSDSSSVPDAVGVVRSASVRANPSVVPVNSDAATNRTEIRALFLTSANAPVQNVRVRFDLDGDLQSIGGTISAGANMVYSDVSGVATTAYVPGARFSPTDGVTIRACWSNADFAAGTCPNAVRTTLTVISEALSVTVGTDNKIGLGSTKLEYVKRYLVQVNDSSGLAKADVQVSPSVDLLRFFKGGWLPGAGQWIKSTVATCDNEDLNRNGVSEVYSNGGVEDANGSYNLVPGRPALEPRKADVLVSFEGSSRTDSKGQVVILITYPQNVASWVYFNLVVAASGVAGTEGRANFDSILPVPSSEVTDLSNTPAWVNSPYGVLASPTILVTTPDGKASGMLCTNPN